MKSSTSELGLKRLLCAEPIKLGYIIVLSLTTAAD